MYCPSLPLVYNIWHLKPIRSAEMVFTSKSASAFQGIRPAKINFYLRGMRDMGYDPKEVLRGTTIDERTLEESFTLIQIPDYIRIVSNMMEISQDPTMAFKLGGYLKSGDLGVLGCAFAASENFNEGMDIWQSYNRLFFGDLISARQFRESDTQYFEFIPQVPLPPHLLQFFMEEKIGVETALAGKLYNCSLEAQYFSVTYPRPEHGNLYEEFLQLEVEFGAERNLYSIDCRDPNYIRRFESANREVCELCLEHLNKITSIANSQETLSPQVRQLLMESLPDIPLLSNLAEAFNMSKRTFCRNLEMEQTSYKYLLAEVREELAKNYLSTTTMGADEIAQQLGFKETSSLCKAFKQWTGSTTKQFREQYQGTLNQI